MLQILKDSDRRLVMRLGDEKLRWRKFILDKDAGLAWFEPARRLLPQPTLTIPLAELAAIDSETIAGGKSATGLIRLTTKSKRRHWLPGDAGATQEAAERMRSFVGLADAQPVPAERPAPSLRGVGLRVAQAAVIIVAVGSGTWLVAQAGGVVAAAAAKTGGLVARSAERIHNTFLLPSCDAPESRSAIQELVRDRLGSSAMLTDIAERGQSGSERICAATAQRDGRTANVSYRNYWDGWTPKVRLSTEIVALKLDAARTAAIGDAIDAFLAASQNSARTGRVPRQIDQTTDRQLSVIFGASDFAAEPLAPAEIDKALAWLKAADRIGTVYLLAGTGFDDVAQVPHTDAIQRRLRGNVVAFADEFGRYADFQMVLLAAIANAQMRASHRPGAIKAGGEEIRAQLSQAMKSNFIALVYDGHNDGWRMARLTALGRTAPVAAKFLSKEDARAVRELALQTVGYFKDASVQARVRDVAGLLGAP